MGRVDDVGPERRSDRRSLRLVDGLEDRLRQAKTDVTVGPRRMKMGKDKDDWSVLVG